MRAVYLIKSEQRDGSLYKVGYTADLVKRAGQYHHYIPFAKMLEFIEVYGKTKHKVETAIHREIVQMGYKFIGMDEDDKRTGLEWFFVDIEHEKEFQAKGLAQFKACKGRKIYKAQK